MLGLSADDLLTTTRAVRKRLDLSRPVPREVIGDCVRIAIQAPSGRNRQRWDFVIVDRLAGVLHEVPALLIAGVRVDGRDELATVRGQAGAWGSVLPALWSFMLAARERGIGTAWTTCHLSYEHEMAELLGIPYEQVVQAALTPVAYTVGTSFRVAPRADPAGFMHWNSW